MLWFKCDEILPGVSLALLYVALCLSGIFIYMENEVIEDVENSCKIPLSAEENIENFRRKNYSAFVVGYSGEVGRHLLEALNRAKVFNRVILIGRRTINLDHIGPEFEQNVVDFNLLEDYANLFKGLEYGFCTLGTSHGSIQSGLMEETLKVMHFQRLSIFRPGVLLCDRAEHRPGDTIFQKILRPVAYFFPTAVTLPVETAAVAMLNNAITPTNRTLDVFENKAIHVVAGMAQQFCPPQEPKISEEKTANKKEPESDL
ncbi:Hypothetical predicted protein [Octopus vulgaris]|uniref:Oxidoreductase HTATIP2 n=1 Tax=Octopus vulgaris TaxID=6645 RepID=A0AA36BTH8_OCTVU|nr:Hypothetical predicted protein [Octopus vulgaris]